MQEGRHVGHVVNAASQLVWLAEIVDPDQQSPTTAGTRRVAKLVVWRGSLAKGLSSRGGEGEGDLFPRLDEIEITGEGQRETDCGHVEVVDVLAMVAVAVVDSAAEGDMEDTEDMDQDTGTEEEDTDTARDASCTQNASNGPAQSRMRILMPQG